MLKGGRNNVKDAEGNATGVRLMCPTCRDNKFTRVDKRWSPARWVHDVSGTNYFVQARRCQCASTACKAVQERVMEKLKNRQTTLAQDLPKTSDGRGGKRDLTTAEVERLRQGKLDGMQPVVAGFLPGGAAFSINTPAIHAGVAGGGAQGLLVRPPSGRTSIERAPGEDSFRHAVIFRASPRAEGGAKLVRGSPTFTLIRIDHPGSVARATRCGDRPAIRTPEP